MHKEQIETLYPLMLAVRQLFHKLANATDALHRDTAITTGMRAVLETVVTSGPMTVPHLARMRPVTRQHIQGFVNQLLERGYVEYSENPAHKRSKLVSPTVQGTATFQAMRQRETSALKRMTLDTGADQFTAATGVLRELIEVFGSERWQNIIDRLDD